ncbi:acid phosphatase [Nesidiocoris tenuis]|uniref:acid phosphatase n=1 Tax=Nesidiocoris tenuis TaxID=355587 RepID=A0ABN7AP14_9HEMI|nr:acid phosphatase [Nesidiocoris tenuis]
MSAEAHLAGMFPITEEQKWGGIDWQPIPIHTVPEQLDKVLAVKHPCKKYHYEKEKLKQSAVYKDLMKKLQPLGEYVSKYTGEPFTSLRIFEYLYSILLVEKMNNLTLPEWTESVFPDQLKVLAGYSLAVPTWTPEMKRLRGGPLVKEILENMKKKIAGTLEPPTRNISIYSAHESTVSAFLNTIDAFDFLPPPFASMVLVELRKTAQNDHVVMVLYKNSTDPTIDPYILTVPGCSAACPLNDFEALLKPIIPVDWDLECQHQENVEPALNQRFDSLAIFGVLFRTPAGSNFTKK